MKDAHAAIFGEVAFGRALRRAYGEERVMRARGTAAGCCVRSNVEARVGRDGTHGSGVEVGDDQRRGIVIGEPGVDSAAGGVIGVACHVVQVV